MKNAQVIFILGIILLISSGCAKYKSKALLKNIPTGVQPQCKDRIVSFAYHVFDKDDCMLYLDRNVIDKGYQPVQITFTNNTDRHLNFLTSTFSFPCAAGQTVAEEVHTNTVGRAVGYGVAGAFIWPFIIPAIVDGIGSSKANKQLDLDFSRKSLLSQIVNPFSTINGLIFVPIESFNPNFSFVVTDIKSHEQFTLSSGHSQLRV